MKQIPLSGLITCFISFNTLSTIIDSDISYFSGSETIIDFDSTHSHGKEITNQYSSSEVTFSGGFCMDESSDNGTSAFDS